MADAAVNLGLIGLGPSWESRFRPALSKLDQRWKVVAVFDEVAARADQAARELAARAVYGVSAVAGRTDIQGLLWLDTGWPGSALIPLVCQPSKPVLLAAGIDLSVSDLSQLQSRCNAERLTVIPILPRRSTPASHRLRELMAIQLGRTIRIEVTVASVQTAAMQFATSADLVGSPPPKDDSLLEWTDWCLNLFRDEPLQTSMQSTSGVVSLEFASLPDGSNARLPRLATIAISPTATTTEVRVDCERGSAVLKSDTSIDWNTADESQSESLTSERSGIEVLLDHFCRKAVGGQIPMPDLSELIRARRIVDQQ